LAGNGFIEGIELDGFLREFVSSVNANDANPEVRLGIKTLSSFSNFYPMNNDW